MMIQKQTRHDDVRKLLDRWLDDHQTRARSVCHESCVCWGIAKWLAEEELKESSAQGNEGPY
jgi:hypothetical protein